MSKPLVLSVFKKDDVAIFDLGETMPIGRYEHLRLEGDLSRKIVQEIQRITSLSNIQQNQPSRALAPPSYSDKTDPLKELEILGKMIFDQLFPNEVKNALRNANIGDLILRLDESLLEIPWELAHDGKAFLGNRCHVGRQVISNRSLNRTRKFASRPKGEQTRVLIISDPTGSLPEVEKETETLVELLDRKEGFHVEVVGGERACKFYILKMLPEFHMVHFAGHSVFNPENPQESGWRLFDGFLGPEEFSRLTDPPRLVFSNSCSSAAAKGSCEPSTMKVEMPGKEAVPVQIASLGLGGSFLLAGVENYVGALWVVHDRSSAHFASYFYEALMTGSTIGDALWNAKRECMSSQSVQTFIWASYTHYGNPQDRPVVFKHRKEGTGEKKASNEGTKTPVTFFNPRRKAFFAGVLAMLLLATGYWIWMLFGSQSTGIIEPVPAANTDAPSSLSDVVEIATPVEEPANTVPQQIDITRVKADKSLSSGLAGEQSAHAGSMDREKSELDKSEKKSGNEQFSAAPESPLPAFIRITPPDKNLPLQLRAFSGYWEGRWDGTLYSQLIVEKIDENSAQVVYSWDAHRFGRFKAGYYRYKATVRSNRIKFGGKGRSVFEFKILDSLNQLKGERKYKHQFNTITMKRKHPGSQSTGHPNTFTNSLGMAFVKVLPGRFFMGSAISPAAVLQRYGGQSRFLRRYMDEHPQHWVTISKPFYMQTTEVTVGQWRSFIRDTGYKTEAETDGGALMWTGASWQKVKGCYWDNPGFPQQEDSPVTCVSWNDVNVFITWLNGREDGHYGLPSEAEWEYACRAGTTTRFCFGNDRDRLDEYAWHWQNAELRTHPVAGKKPNPWGLYDMHGNVWEWCRDWYGDYAFASVEDPEGPGSGIGRVDRGGGWMSSPARCRSGARNSNYPRSRNTDIGFRLVQKP